MSAQKADRQAGGVPTILNELHPLLHLDAMSITGRSLGEELATFISFSQNIVRSMSDALVPHSPLVVLKGNLAPDGCVVKASAMGSRLRKHAGRAVVFANVEDLMERVDDPGLDVDEDSV